MSYSRALAPLVMTGNVPTSAEPVYEEETYPYEKTPLQKIESKNYGMGKKKATPEQAAKLYRAVAALAYAKIQESNYCDLDEGSTPHSKAVFAYYQKSLKSFSQKKPLLKQLAEATSKENRPAYESSPYVGIVLVDSQKVKALQGLKPQLDWINQIDVKILASTLAEQIHPELKDKVGSTVYFSNRHCSVENIPSSQKFSDLAKNVLGFMGSVLQSTCAETEAANTAKLEALQKAITLLTTSVEAQKAIDKELKGDRYNVEGLYKNPEGKPYRYNLIGSTWQEALQAIPQKQKEYQAIKIKVQDLLAVVETSTRVKSDIKTTLTADHIYHFAKLIEKVLPVVVKEKEWAYISRDNGWGGCERVPDEWENKYTVEPYNKEVGNLTKAAQEVFGALTTSPAGREALLRYDDKTPRSLELIYEQRRAISNSAIKQCKFVLDQPYALESLERVGFTPEEIQGVRDSRDFDSLQESFFSLLGLLRLPRFFSQEQLETFEKILKLTDDGMFYKHRKTVGNFEWGYQARKVFEDALKEKQGETKAFVDKRGEVFSKLTGSFNGANLTALSQSRDWTKFSDQVRILAGLATSLQQLETLDSALKSVRSNIANDIPPLLEQRIIFSKASLLLETAFKKDVLLTNLSQSRDWKGFSGTFRTLVKAAINFEQLQALKTAIRPNIDADIPLLLEQRILFNRAFLKLNGVFEEGHLKTLPQSSDWAEFSNQFRTLVGLATSSQQVQALNQALVIVKQDIAPDISQILDQRGLFVENREAIIKSFERFSDTDVRLLKEAKGYTDFVQELKVFTKTDTLPALEAIQSAYGKMKVETKDIDEKIRGLKEKQQLEIAIKTASESLQSSFSETELTALQQSTTQETFSDNLVALLKIAPTVSKREILCGVCTQLGDYVKKISEQIKTKLTSAKNMETNLKALRGLTIKKGTKPQLVFNGEALDALVDKDEVVFIEKLNPLVTLVLKKPIIDDLKSSDLEVIKKAYLQTALDSENKITKNTVKNTVDKLNFQIAKKKVVGDKRFTSEKANIEAIKDLPDLLKKLIDITLSSSGKTMEPIVIEVIQNLPKDMEQQIMANLPSQGYQKTMANKIKTALEAKPNVSTT